MARKVNPNEGTTHDCAYWGVVSESSALVTRWVCTRCKREWTRS